MSAAKLIELLHKLRDVRSLVIGDLMLDRYVWGSVDRISQEAPVPIVEVSKTEDRLGGAANAALNLKEIGSRVTMAGIIGDDDEGNRLLGLLDRHKIDREGVLVDSHRPTTLKTRVVAQSQQVVRIDRELTFESGIALQEKFSKIIEEKIDEVDVVVVSDYGKGTLSTVILKRFAEWGKEGRFSMKKRPLVLDPHPRNHGLYEYVTVAKPNRSEAIKASGVEIRGRRGADEAASVLLDRWKADLLLVTLSESGMLLKSKRGEPRFIDTDAKQVFDVSGAGDTVTAVFSAALGAGAEPQAAGELSTVAAGIAVSQVGTTPVAAIQIESALKEQLS